MTLEQGGGCRTCRVARGEDAGDVARGGCRGVTWGGGRAGCDTRGMARGKGTGDKRGGCNNVTRGCQHVTLGVQPCRRCHNATSQDVERPHVRAPARLCPPAPPAQGIVPTRLLCPGATGAVPGRNARGFGTSGGRSRDTAQGSPQGSGRRAEWSCPSWEVSPLQDVASSGHGDPAAPAWILRLRPCGAAAVEGGLRGRSAHGQSGGREGPVLLLLLGSHLPSSPLLLPQEGLSPPHPTEHPGADSGAWGARGVPAWQPGVGGGFWGAPWPGDPAAAPPAQAAPARGRLLPRCSVNQPQEGLVRAAPKNLIGTRAGRAGGAPDSKPRPGCTSCAPGGIHRAPPVVWLLPNPWEFRAFTALLLRPDLVRGIAATLGPLGGAGTGQSHLDVPTACSFASSPLLGALGPVPLSPSLPVCAPSQSCSSVCPG